MTWNRPERDERTLGDWTIERRDDELADLQWRGHRVLRSIRAVVRDGDWNALPLTVGEITGDDSRLEIAVRTTEPAFEGVLRATADAAELAIILDLRAVRDVDTNRTGLVARELAEQTVELFGRNLATTGCLHEFYNPDTGEAIMTRNFQNWNFLVLNLIAYLDGRPVVAEF